MSVYSIIQELAATRSSNDKKAILQREVANEDLKTFFRLALSNQIMFYQKKPISSTHKVVGFNLGEAMLRLEENIAGRMITGNSARAYIEDLFNWVSVEDEFVLKLILQKKSGCDIGAAVVNKIWAKLIPEFPCLLATNWDDKLGEKLFKSSDIIYSQKKSDGLRCSIIIDEDGNVSAYTRAGNELNLFGVFDGLGQFTKSVVIDGELLTTDKTTGKFNSRQVSNGICSKAIHGTMSKAESEQLHMTAWDIIPLKDFKEEKSNLHYSTRWYDLQQLLTNNKSINSIISLIDTKIVKTIEEAQEHYQQMQAAGEEGTVVKSAVMLWESRRSKLQLKCKSELICELKVTGWLPGKGEFEGNLGALTMSSSDGKVVVNISGFSVKLRTEIFANLTNKPASYDMVVDGNLKTFIVNPADTDIDIGAIVSVKYNAKIKDRNSDVWSLFLPRFECSRMDKLTANSFDEIK